MVRKVIILFVLCFEFTTLFVQLRDRIEKRKKTNAAKSLQRLWKSKRGNIRAEATKKAGAATLIQTHARRTMGKRRHDETRCREVAARLLQASYRDLASLLKFVA